MAKKWICLVLAAVLMTLLGCSSGGAESTTAAAGNVTVRVGAMSGATAMGMVKLMDDSRSGNTRGSYDFADLATEAAAFVAPLSQGKLDIAAVPVNLASVLYNKTQGGVQVLAACVGSVLCIVERGNDIAAFEDLKGKTLYATGQGAMPEAVLRCLCLRSGLDIEQDLSISWCADTTEALARISADTSAVALLPQPFVTAACAKVEGLRPALDLGNVWGDGLITGVIVVRSAFARENPEAVAAFLAEYAASAAFTGTDPEEAGRLIADFGILASAGMAQKALPGCHILALTGEAMRAAVSATLEAIGNVNSQLIGGALPQNDFYYGAD